MYVYFPVAKRKHKVGRRDFCAAGSSRDAACFKVGDSLRESP
jgi:hypothetical protein